MKIEHHLRLNPPMLKTLTDSSGERLISLLMPTHRAGQETRQDPIRFKNIAQRARQALHELGADEHEIKRRLEPLEEIESGDQEANEFWQHQSDGLAMFIDDQTIQSFRLPNPFQETSAVGSCYHLKPLLSRPVTKQKFYVLIASKDELHLLECTRDGWDHLTFDELPEGREAIMKFVDEERQLQFHSTGAGRGPGNPQAAVFHGHGAAEQHEKARILEYFQAVNRTLHRMMIDYRTPIVFAGVDYLYPIFREAVHEINLLDEHIPGNHDEKKGDFDSVHKQAVEIIDRRFERDTTEALNEFGSAAGAGQTSTNIDDIMLGAEDGRIAALLLDPSTDIHGQFDREGRNVRTTDSPTVHDFDLANFACVLTARHGGEIVTVERDRMPDRKPIAAMFRY